jgi:hypothetical protein
MRRTDFSASRAIALRSALMSQAVASPQLTVTSIVDVNAGAAEEKTTVRGGYTQRNR